jgi:hypothetical protein
VTTPLAKPVSRRSTGAGVNRRQYVVTLAPGDIIGFRDVRSRTTYWLPLAACYAQAVRAEVARRRAEKAAKRKTHRR